MHISEVAFMKATSLMVSRQRFRSSHRIFLTLLYFSLSKILIFLRRFVVKPARVRHSRILY